MNYAPFELSQTVAVLTQAVESNERQIHEVAAMSAQSTKDLSVLIEKQGTQLNARLEALGENFQTSQKPNYMLWLAVLATVFTLISAGWKITDLQTTNTVSPVIASMNVLAQTANTNAQSIAREMDRNAKIESDLATNTARDGRSEEDRIKLNQHAVITDAKIAGLEKDNAVLEAKLVEIETQKRGDAQARNIQFANQLRYDALVWEKVFGTRYPSEIQYYPDISTFGGASK